MNDSGDRRSRLERLTMQPGYVDNRCSSRYEAVKSAVYLGWWEEPEFRTTVAVLRNLSQGGALVNVGLMPPETATFYLCLAGAPPSDWAEVTIVDKHRLIEGLHEVRLMFSVSCPYEIFHEAALGLPQPSE
jgi:hypothetical protein